MGEHLAGAMPTDASNRANTGPSAHLSSPSAPTGARSGPSAVIGSRWWVGYASTHACLAMWLRSPQGEPSGVCTF